MTTNKQTLSFGHYLKAKRVEKGVSLKEVSQETMIGVDSLLSIELEDHSKLPAEVFVKGFLRAYAKAIGADGDKVVRLYLSNVRACQETARFEADLIRSSTKFWPRLLLSLGILFAIIAVTFFMITRDQEKTVQKDSPVSRENAEAVPAKKPEQQKAPEVVKQPDVKDKKLSLKIMTIKETWMKVIIDGKSPKVYNLNSGDRLELEADSGFNLLIGNAGGVKLTYNNRPFRVLGKNGQVVNVHLP